MTQDAMDIARAVLSAVRPEIDLSSLPADLVASGTIDSFDLIMLVTEIESRTSRPVPGDMIRAENFASVNAMAQLIATVMTSES